MESNDRPTQERRVLQVLQDANGAWVSGQYFLHQMMLSQYHARIFNLQRNRDRFGYQGTIEASGFTDDWGFKSYRLVQKAEQMPMPI